MNIIIKGRFIRLYKIKYINQIEYEHCKEANIQAILLIEENVKILRKLVWLNDIIALINKQKKITIIIKLFQVLLFIININGAIFCQVNKIKQFTHDKPSITSGNQKWNGAAPNFIKNAEFIIKIKEFMGGINSL